MKDASDVIPWTVTDISIRPYDGYWSFNPSIHFDGDTWRCVLRCCDYAMPDGVTIRSKNARPTGQQTKNAMVILDPKSWRPVEIFKMHERDNLVREACPHIGYEDMRIFKTDKGGLQGIAASLHLRRDRERAEGMTAHQPPEQVLLSFDENYDIVDAHPIRGDGWSGTPQKNWIPFDRCAEPRFLYSIDKGTLFSDRGSLRGDEAQVIPSNSFPDAKSVIAAPERQPEQPPEQPPEQRPEPSTPQDRRSKKKDRKSSIRGGDMRLVRGARLKLDAMTARTPPRSSSRSSPSRNSNDAVRMMGSGRVLLPTYNGLRGGSQLVRVAEDAWLGVGHEMKWANYKKYYWHVWYVVNSRGRMTATSEPMKFAPGGIEFAAGMAIDGNRVVVSFGVDDMESKLGETKLSAVMEMLRPIAR